LVYVDAPRSIGHVGAEILDLTVELSGVAGGAQDG
jgi:hypothetical protein